MMRGKAVSRALRCHFLAEAGLMTRLGDSVLRDIDIPWNNADDSESGDTVFQNDEHETAEQDEKADDIIIAWTANMRRNP